MSPKHIITICIFIFGVSISANAQTGFSHEIGAFIGPVAFQSDFGERHDFGTNAGNTGFGVGIIHYLNFSYTKECNCFTPKTFFNDHFKIRSELSYSNTKLDHFGRWIEGKPSLGKEQLIAMKGNTSVANIGFQLEYYPLSIRDFTVSDGGWAPFISLGSQFSFYTSKTTSNLGPLGSPLYTFPKYLDASDGKTFGFDSESNTVWSVVGSVGTRYKLTPLSDLMLEVRLQYYFSDWVDGLNPNHNLHPENRANDWLLWLNIGYIHYL